MLCLCFNGYQRHFQFAVEHLCPGFRIFLLLLSSSHHLILVNTLHVSSPYRPAHSTRLFSYFLPDLSAPFLISSSSALLLGNPLYDVLLLTSCHMTPGWLRGKTWKVWQTEKCLPSPDWQSFEVFVWPIPHCLQLKAETHWEYSDWVTDGDKTSIRKKILLQKQKSQHLNWQKWCSKDVEKVLSFKS